jgi:RNA polymerase sigma-70 factor (ECF subfamily)
MPRSPGSQADRYSQVAEEYSGALERLARAYEPDADKRRDLLQEIHIAMWRSLARFDHRCSMRTWVYRVAHNVATSHVIRPRANAPTFVEPVALDSLPDSVDQADRYHRQRTLERVYDLIRELGPVDRQVMLLYLEEVDAATTAEITGLSAGNVATRIHRIKQVLAQRFHERGAGRG